MTLATRMTPGAHCVYAHYHADEDVCFYVGSGSIDSGRAFRGGRWRSLKWQAYVKQIGDYRVRIVEVLVEETTARQRERIVAAELKPVLGFNPVYGGKAK